MAEQLEASSSRSSSDHLLSSLSISRVHSEDRNATMSLFNRLHCQKPSELAHKRNIDHNPPPKGKKRSYCGGGTSGPKFVTPNQRISEHPGECVTVLNYSMMFCRACREERSLIRWVINNHITSVKHQNGKKWLDAKKKSE